MERAFRRLKSKKPHARAHATTSPCTTSAARLDNLATLTKKTVGLQSGLPTFDQLTVASPLQKQAFEFLEVDLKP